MTSSVIEIGGRQFAVGLSWSSIDADVRVAGIRAEAKRLGASMISSDAEVGPVGFFVGSRLRTKVVSFAGVSCDHPLVRGADHSASCVIAFDIDQETSLLVIVSHGVVQSDMVASRLEVKGAIRDHIDYIGATASLLYFGESEAFPDRPQKITVEDWVAGCLDGGDAALLCAVPNPIIKRLAIGAAILVVVGCVVGWKMWSAAQEEERKARDRAMADPNAMYERSLQSALGSAGAPAARIAPVLDSFFDELPVRVAGWTWSGVSCAILPAVCTVNYRRESGTNRDFAVAAASFCASPEFVVSGDLVRCQVSLSGLPSPGRQRNESYPNVRELFLREASLFQHVSSLVVGTSQPLKMQFAGTATLFGGTGGVDVSSLSSPILLLAFNGTGGRLYQRDILEALPSNCFLSEISIAPVTGADEGTSLSLKGGCYASR